MFTIYACIRIYHKHHQVHSTREVFDYSESDHLMFNELSSCACVVFICILHNQIHTQYHRNQTMWCYNISDTEDGIHRKTQTHAQMPDELASDD